MMPRSEAEQLIEALRSKGLRMSAAESCTGGMIGCMMTSVPGSSDVFLGTAVTYSNDAKERILGVKHQTLMDHGAVSMETASEMAKGSVEVYESDVAVAVTG
ncbi:MAG: CinA family protein, partial [Candidatus Methanomethylophilaceae archaeon]|nr:CinA family protein [Candidatus Methanomethylophilaceae archaeon]